MLFTSNYLEAQKIPFLNAVLFQVYQSVKRADAKKSKNARNIFAGKALRPKEKIVGFPYAFRGKLRQRKSSTAMEFPGKTSSLSDLARAYSNRQSSRIFL
jgi:hypothetical protein